MMMMMMGAEAGVLSDEGAKNYFTTRARTVCAQRVYQRRAYGFLWPSS